MCALTFELRRERRYGAWPAGWMMYHSRRRAKCYAGASRLQRRVRPQLPCLLTLANLGALIYIALIQTRAAINLTVVRVNDANVVASQRLERAGM